MIRPGVRCEASADANYKNVIQEIDKNIAKSVKDFENVARASISGSFMDINCMI
jgi:hypothetical protein